MTDDINARIDMKFQEHISDFHGNLEAGEGAELIEEHQQMVKDTGDNKEMLQRMVKAIEGKPTFDLAGNVIGHEGGLVNQVNEIEKKASNGGLNAKFVPTSAQLWTFWIGAIGVVTALAYLVIAVINATEMSP